MCSPIGAILTEDQDGNDVKIIAVPLTMISLEFDKVNNIYDLPVFFREKLEHIIRHHKDLESGKFVKGIKWEEKYAAEQIILQAIERKRKKINKI